LELIVKRQKQTKAVLIFADSLKLDLVRRHWPEYFRNLLRLPISSWQELPGEADLHLFTRSAASCGFDVDAPIEIHLQPDRPFAENLEAALEELFLSGYEDVVVIGRDCPGLVESDLLTAFELLDNHRLVLGPDHRGGLYLIGLHLAERDLLKRIAWQRDTDCRQLIDRAGPESTRLLPVKQDLDSLSDIELLSRTGYRLRSLARSLLATLTRLLYRAAVLFPDNELERTSWQLPPPSPITCI
jgi:hypothetical protein